MVLEVQRELSALDIHIAWYYRDLASYFAAYEVTKKALTPAGSSPSDLNLGAVVFAGGMAGVAMWAIAIPPDVSNESSSKLTPDNVSF
jgi:hypothetical protein